MSPTVSGGRSGPGHRHVLVPLVHQDPGREDLRPGQPHLIERLSTESLLAGADGLRRGAVQEVVDGEAGDVLGFAESGLWRWLSGGVSTPMRWLTGRGTFLEPMSFSVV